MNWFDLIVGGLFLLALFDGLRRGFFSQTLELAVFAVSIWLSLRYYGPVADWLVWEWHASPLLAKPVGFLVLWLAVQGIGFVALWLVGRSIPESLKRSGLNHVAGFVPALVKTTIYIGLGLTIALALPLPLDLKTSLNTSWSGPRLITVTSGLSKWLEHALGRTFVESFAFLTTPKTGVGFSIPAITDSSKLRVEPELEHEVFALVNAERVRAGLMPLAFDSEAQAVARAHSEDMWQRGFFDHVNPDGKDVGDRFHEAGVTFMIAGENLALAPTVPIAHEGLMHSESHRENILHPDFHRLGVGVISAGAQGLMITQNFRD